MKRVFFLLVLAAINVAIYGFCQGVDPQVVTTPYVVFGYNDVGMHPVNQDYSELGMFPLGNNFRATVIDRTGALPKIVTSGIVVKYSIPGNTESATKSNFWTYVQQLFGSSPAANIGLSGYGMKGRMALTADSDWMAKGVPVTEINDALVDQPYQFGKVVVTKLGVVMGSTGKAVLPVSWEITCSQCHTRTGKTVAAAILASHDSKHGTSLSSQKPVLCAKCHADASIGKPGSSSLPSLSRAIHSSHANRMGTRTGTAQCYACHPGTKTKMLRDVHVSKGFTCQSCHTSMAAVGASTRKPWVDEPKCGGCHSVTGHEYEQAGVLFKDSIGHNGVKCIVCHGSAHAIAKSTNLRDNQQAVAIQGVAGTINVCTVCHSSTPSNAFNHTRLP